MKRVSPVLQLLRYPLRHNPWMVEKTIPAPHEFTPASAAPSRADLLRLAADPGTHPGRLAEIHKSTKRDRDINAALARNPATPNEVLQYLWRKDPDAILQNPIVTLWEFSMPGSTKRRISSVVQFALYQHLVARAEFDPQPELIDYERLIFWLSRPSRYTLRIPLHLVVRDTRPQIRLNLIHYQVRHACRTLRRPVGFPREAILALATGTDRDVDEALASAIADDCLRPEPLDMAFLARIARLLLEKRAGSISIAGHVAKWPCIDSDLVERLARRADDHFLSLLAAHPQASASFQESLASHPSEIVRAALAAATRIGHLIHKLASDSNPIVLAALASSPNVPLEIQRALFAKKDPRILQSLLQNARTAPEILEDMSRLPFLDLAKQLCIHPNAPLRLRRQLLKHTGGRRGRRLP